MRIVIDCNILVFGLIHGNWNALSVLDSVQKVDDHLLVLDFGGNVEQEYRGNVGENRLFQTWYKATTQYKAPYWSKGRLTNRHRSNLVERGFHESSDHVYVALADETDRYIVTQDSDFGKSGNPERDNTAALDYMTGTMGLTVHNAAEASATL